MAEPVYSRPVGKQYLGNRSEKEVHDLWNEDTSEGGCQIDEIIEAGHAVVFTPDTLGQADKESYDPCAKCLPSSRR